MISDVWGFCRDQEQRVWGLLKELWDGGRQGLGVAVGGLQASGQASPWESLSKNIIKFSKMVETSQLVCLRWLLSR